MNFHLEIIVWGKPFIETFLSVSLPSLLWPSNLPHLAKTASCIMSLYTTPADKALLLQAPVFQELCELMPVEIIDIADVTAAQQNSQRMTDCLNHFVRTAKASAPGLVFLCPDSMYGDGSFVALERIARQGKRIVLTSGLRTVKDEMLAALHLEQGRAARPMSTRELARLSLEHLHPQQDGRFWNGPRVMTEEFALLCWKVGTHGLLMRAFCLHPILVFQPEQYRGVSMELTVDYLYPPLLHPAPEDVHIVDDSDEMCIIELSDRNLFAQQSWRAGAMKIDEVADWAEPVLGYWHRQQLLRKVRVHGAPLDTTWSAVEMESDRIVSAILEGLGEPAAARRASANSLSVVITGDRLSAIDTTLRGIQEQLVQPVEVVLAGEEGAQRAALYASEFPHLAIRPAPQGRKELYSLVHELSADYVVVCPAGAVPINGFFEKALNLLKWYPEAGLCCSDPVSIEHDGELVQTHLPWTDIPSCKATALDVFFSADLFAAKLRNFPLPLQWAVVRRQPLLVPGTLLPELEWFAWDYAVLVAALRNGACYVPEALFAIPSHAAMSPLARRGPRERGKVLETIVAQLLMQKESRLLSALAISKVLSRFGQRAIDTVLANPRLWTPETLFLLGSDPEGSDLGVACTPQLRALGLHPQLQHDLARADEACREQRYLDWHEIIERIRENYPACPVIIERITALSRTLLPNLSSNPQDQNNWIGLGLIAAILGQKENAGKLIAEACNMANDTRTRCRLEMCLNRLQSA